MISIVMEINKITITRESFDGWQVNDPWAVQVVLFESGLWHELLSDCKEAYIDSMEDAILRVNRELQNRADPIQYDNFISTFVLQAKRRFRDMNVQHAQRWAEPNGNLNRRYSHADAEIEQNPENAIPDCISQDPYSECFQDLTTDLADQLIENFYEILTPIYQRHLTSVEQCMWQSGMAYNDRELCAAVVEYLFANNPNNSTFTGAMIEECCQTRNTFFTHSIRIRKQWAQFLKSEHEGNPLYENLKAAVRESQREHSCAK